MVVPKSILLEKLNSDQGAHYAFSAIHMRDTIFVLPDESLIFRSCYKPFASKVKMLRISN